MQATKEIALIAVDNDAFATPYVDSRLRTTPDLQQMASRNLERTRSPHLTSKHLDLLGLDGQVYRQRNSVVPAHAHEPSV